MSWSGPDFDALSSPPDFYCQHAKPYRLQRLSLFSRGLQCSLVWCKPLAYATIYHADACPGLFAYEPADFRQMHFLNAMAVSIWLIFFAKLNDNGSARCFTSTHTSPACVWDCWRWSAESELRFTRGVGMGSVRKGYVLLFTCSCVSVSVKPVYTFCSHHAFDVQPRKRMRVCVCVSMLVRVYVCACVCGKLMAVASFLFCH